MNPLLPFLERLGWMVLDGGLATTLEAHGCDLDDPLWSAKALLESPDRVAAVHREFLEAGADCITTVTYQATIAGFRRRGLTDTEARSLLRLAADIACETRDVFWADTDTRGGRLRPLVAASIGPYGAYLADGGEYRGDYDLDDDALYEFHQERWHTVADTGVDVIACETIPSLPEARALLRLLCDTPTRWAWMSFSCRDAQHISDGTGIEHLAELCASVPNVAAMGVNCVAPSLVLELIANFGRATGHPVVVYPNSGEGYDALHKSWTGQPFADEWPVGAWRDAGATIIGGCCRVRPEAIRALRARLQSSVH